MLCRNVAIYLEPGARRRLYATLVAALSARGILLLGRSERLLDPAALGLLQVAPHAYERVGMRQRLTLRTVAVSVLIVAVVATVLGSLAIAIGRQRDAGERARRSQAVIAAANLTQQRLLAVQTNIRGFLIRGNPDLITGYRAARAGLPAAALELRAARRARPGAAPAGGADPRGGAGLRQQLRRPGDRAHARGRASRAGRAFAGATEGASRAEDLSGADRPARRPPSGRCPAGSRATPTPRPSAPC